MALRRPASSKGPSRSSCGFPWSSAEAEQLASGPLQNLQDAVHTEVKCGALAGAAHVVLRHGKCVVAFADGKASKESKFTLRTLNELPHCFNFVPSYHIGSIVE